MPLTENSQKGYFEPFCTVLKSEIDGLRETAD